MRTNNNLGTSSEISRLSLYVLKRAHPAKLIEIEQDIKDVKEQLEMSVMMSYNKNKNKSRHEMGGEAELGDNILSTLALML